MSLDAIERAVRQDGLTIRGAFHPEPEDGAPPGTATLILLGPDEGRFWPLFQGSPEHAGGRPDPLDRWSRRVIGGLARRLRGRAVFPFGGPPYHPFLRWAERSGRCFPSPTGLLVHDAAGLMISFRGALALIDRVALAPTGSSPCRTCAGRPCESACPVGALRPGQAYDVEACRAHVRSDAGAACRTGGCLVRRACPLSQEVPRPAEQSAYHMAAFAGTA